jgi:pilus assembly protein FimV
VKLADAAVFKKAGVEKSSIHQELRFKVQNHEQDGRPVIRVTTREPVKELGLSFFIEATWLGSNMVRAYDILLTPALGPNASMADQPRRDPNSAIDARRVPRPPTVNSRSPARGLEYGPVGRGEILGVIARKMVPSRDFSLQQVMVGIFDQNPHAFPSGNINELEPGVMLNLESPQSVTARSKNAAINLIQHHTQDWRGQAKPSSGPTPVNEGSVSSIFKIEEVDDSELQILAPGQIDAEKDGKIMPSEITALRQELTVTLQEAEALKKQNEALKAKVDDLEKMVAQRLAQLMPENVSALELGEQTSIINKSDKVFQDDLVASESDISLRDEEEEYFTEIMGLLLVVLGGALFFFLYRQRQQGIVAQGMDSLTFWEQFKSVFKKKDKKITLKI